MAPHPHPASHLAHHSEVKVYGIDGQLVLARIVLQHGGGERGGEEEAAEPKDDRHAVLQSGGGEGGARVTVACTRMLVPFLSTLLPTNKPAPPLVGTRFKL